MAGILTSRKRAYAQALASGQSRAEAAATVGVKPRTARRYLTDPLVRAEVGRLQDQAFGKAAALASRAASKAVLRLETIMDDPTATPSVRVSAARAILEHAPRLNEQTNLGERLAALEELLEGQNDKSRKAR